MKLSFNVSPNLRQRQSTSQIMLELMIGLLVVFAGTLVYYFMSPELGSEYVIRAIVLLATAVIAAIGTEFVWCLATKQKFNVFIKGSFPLITAIILVLMVPVNTSVYAIAMGTMFALLIGKLIFGGFGHNIFNPAAVGRAVVLFSFTAMATQMDAFTSATTTTTVASTFNWLIADSAAVAAFFEQTSMFTLWSGQYVGAIGETNTLLILVVGIVLAIRNVIDWRTPAIYVGSIFLFTLGIALFKGLPSVDGLSILWYPLAHLATGGAMFGAIFMLTDPVTSPTSIHGRIVFAIGAAFITVLIRVMGNYPEGVLFAILIMNMLTPMIERLFDGKQTKNMKKAYITTATVFGLALVTLLAGTNSIALATAEELPSETGGLTFGTVSGFASEFESATDNGDGTTTYKVGAEGFYPDLNKFEVVVNNDTNEIVSFKNTVNNDTPGIGDAIQEASFTNQFTRKVIDDSFEVDAASGATLSSKSAVRAIYEISQQIGN